MAIIINPRSVYFTVVGHPQPAGSKRAFPNKGGGVSVVDDNPKAKSWQAEVSVAAIQAMIDAELEMFEGPCGMAVIFTLVRPKGHFGTGKNAGVLKESAPPYPIVKPDTTKLLRGVEDAMTTIVYRDDSQVVEQAVSKHYGTPEGVRVSVWTM
jgi:Holliday junction resolvase RusA-like endonuclease